MTFQERRSSGRLDLEARGLYCSSFQELARIRWDTPAAAYGNYETLLSEPDLLVFERRFPSSAAVVAIHRGERRRDIGELRTALPRGRYEDALHGRLAGVPLTRAGFALEGDSVSIWTWTGKPSGPQIGSVWPAMGQAGVRLTNAGRGFGSSGTLRISDAEARVISWKAEEILTVIPAVPAGRHPLSIGAVRSNSSVEVLAARLIPVTVTYRRTEGEAGIDARFALQAVGRVGGIMKPILDIQSMRSKSLLFGLICASLCWAQPGNQSGIAHVAFRVANLEAARAFYNKLGFDQFFEMKQGDRTTEAFLKINDHQFIELYPRTDPSQPLGLMHVCYESSNLEALHAEYVKRGLTVSEVRKAGAGNMLMTMKDPEGQIIEYTQYMPGSRHFEDRGKHLGAKRVAQLMVGATSPARDATAMRVFYLEKLGFTEINHGIPTRLRMPGDSGQEVDIAAAGAEAKSGIQFGVVDVKHTAGILTALGLAAKASPENNPTALTVADPDGAAISFVKAALPDAAAQDYFNNWPAGMSPTEIGTRLTAHFVTSPHQNPQRIIYPEVCTWYGALTFAHLSGDKDLLSSVIKRFDPLFSVDAGMIQRSPHVDFSVFGALPLQIYIENKDAKYLDLGKGFADRQWENPRPDGLSPETRFWIDDMYMETIVQVQAFRATGDRKYLDRSALEMVAYLDKLQQPNGLFYHEAEVKFYWGRGNGWVAAGMAELLRSLPTDHPRRARILKGYRKMMESLLEFQGTDGMWRQLIDRSDSWPETSSTGMFTFAMVTGVKNGWLDAPTYGPAARRAWLALVGYIDQNADVTSVCEGTNKLDDLDYYLGRKRRTGDFHGQAPVLWTASALLR